MGMVRAVSNLPPSLNGGCSTLQPNRGHHTTPTQTKHYSSEFPQNRLPKCGNFMTLAPTSPKTRNLISNSLDAIFNKARIWGDDFRGRWDSAGKSVMGIFGKELRNNAICQGKKSWILNPTKGKRCLVRRPIPISFQLSLPSRFRTSGPFHTSSCSCLASPENASGSGSHGRGYKKYVEMKTHLGENHPWN